MEKFKDWDHMCRVLEMRTVRYFAMKLKRTCRMVGTNVEAFNKETRQWEVVYRAF